MNMRAVQPGPLRPSNDAPHHLPRRRLIAYSGTATARGVTVIRIAPVAAALLALAACAKSEEASLVPPQEDDGYNMVDPVTAPLAVEGELALGEWASSMQDDEPALLFGPPQTSPLFSLRCDGREGLILQRHGVIVGPGMNMMVVELGGATRRLAVNPVQGTLPLLRAAAPANTELIGELASAQDRITVRIGNGEPLVMPSSPLLGEFIRGCSEQRADTAPGNVAEAAGPPATAAEPAANSAEPRPTARRPE
jgi:hypothetical protein